MRSTTYQIFRTLGLAALVIAAGCTLTARGNLRPPPPVTVHAEVQAPPPPTGHVQVQVGSPTMGAGVTVVETSCTQGAQETCNGIDDNCNGQIDEGCGYSSGAIQVTLMWNTGADLDMYVTDPSGETISYQNRSSSSGGNLDHDARGQCRASEPNNTIENIFWNSPQPPSGNYTVALNYFGECNSGAGATTATLSVSVGGQIIGSWQKVLMPQSTREDFITFNIP